MDLGAALAGALEPQAELDRLDGRDREQAFAEARRQALERRRVAAEPRRQAERADLEHAAERVARLARRVDPRREARVGLGIERVAGRGRAQLGAPRAGGLEGVRAHGLAAELDDVGEDLDPEVLEHLPRRAGQGDARGGLARAGALEHRARVAHAELLAAGQVGVARPWIARDGELLDHRVAVLDQERQRRAQGQARAQPREHLGPVVLDLHPAAAAQAALPASELRVDAAEVEGQPRGQPLEDPDQADSVRFPGRGPAELAHFGTSAASMAASSSPNSKGLGTKPTTPGTLPRERRTAVSR